MGQYCPDNSPLLIIPLCYSFLLNVLLSLFPPVFLFAYSWFIACLELLYLSLYVL